VPSLRWLSNVCLPTCSLAPEVLEARWRVGVGDHGGIERLHPIDPGSSAAGDDWHGDWLSPMGIDLQINGGLGLAFPELGSSDLETLDALQALLWEDGVDAITPTIVTCPPQALHQALSVLREARRQRKQRRCRLLGAHLEGPFFSEKRRGAHPRDQIAPPTRGALRKRIEGFQCGPEADIALVTMAAEQPGAEEIVRELTARGVVVCLGHTSADERQADEAFTAGVEMLTHTFNAMPGLINRAPGPIAAALMHGGIAMGLIADGVHVSPSLAVLLQRLAPRQINLVSDALAPYGLGDGRYRWGKRPLLVQDGTCRLEDGTLAGVTLPLLEGVKRLARWGGQSSAAIASATVVPRQTLLRRPVTVESLLLYRPLSTCLRWGEASGRLHWRHCI